MTPAHKATRPRARTAALLGLLGGGMLLARLAAAAPSATAVIPPGPDVHGNRTVSGAFSAELPTDQSLGFDWRIGGDDNRNASVAVSYRKQGDKEWITGMPLMRLQHEDVNAAPGGMPPPHPNGMMLGRPPLYYKVPNMFSGSIFYLQPDTAYEVKLVLHDPDGVKGATVHTATVRTRSVPKPAADGKVYHVYPWNYKGPKQQPAFTGLLAALFMESRHADWANASPQRVQPGDTVLVHAGLYQDNPQFYGDGVEGKTEARLATEFDGTYYLTISGTAERPIVIKAAGDGEVIFDGNGTHNLFNLMAGNYLDFEGITVRNTDVAFLLGVKHIAGSSGFTLRHSKIENVGRGIQDDWAGSRNFYITDNVFIGRHDPYHMLGWTAAWEKFPNFPEVLNGPHGSEYAVKVYGQGHVVAYNEVRNFHDGVDVATYGDPEGAPGEIPDLLPASIDFHNNYFYNMSDNCIEGDGGARNIRIYENLCLNAAGGAFSAQTIFGGPAYFFRNVVYSGVGGSIKFSITPAGILTYNNTYISENNTTGVGSNAHFLNNLFFATGTGKGATFSVTTLTNYTSSDYNGFHGNPAAAQPFAWNSPRPEVQQDSTDAPVMRAFKSLAEYQQATGEDRHSIQVDYDIFERVAPPDPSDMQRLYGPGGFDFRLKPGSAAVDAGVVIPNITDHFTGKAPDLGALEQGVDVPHYGPRH